MAWFSRKQQSTETHPDTAAGPLTEGSPTAPTGAGAGVAPGASPSAPDTGRYGPRVRVTELDQAPQELTWQLPLQGELYRLMPGPDRPDYSLMVLERPLHFYPADTFDRGRVPAEQLVEDRRGRPMVRVHALLLCARFVGQQLHPGMSDLAVNIAYVIDPSLAQDDSVDFAKIEYAAVGLLSEGHVDAGSPAAADGPAAAGAPAGTHEADTHEAEAPRDVDGRDSAGGEVPAPVDRPDPAAQAAVDAAAGAGAAPGAGTDPQTPEPVDPADVAGDGPPPMVLMGEVLPEVANALRSGIEQQRSAAVERLTVTLQLDEQHRVTGLSGNADGAPPVPTPETFERLNAALARLNELPENHAVRGLTLRIDGDQLDSDIDYRS
ncbi:hypothetical protein [Terracoccus luteus]|uniref:Uncharacterized protein n=1 Tax=Terracoccus luteus TaxID=53356 RepID=A0A839PTR9_9MICO|nr:hypothetical protein [Terracoccus luteus]MBB2986907.1 hypothetical protein [Terracoccus luteus]MCP2172558.1 hypothetical protein [Terracoccus luteus]